MLHCLEEFGDLVPTWNGRGRQYFYALFIRAFEQSPVVGVEGVFGSRVLETPSAAVCFYPRGGLYRDAREQLVEARRGPDALAACE